MGLARTAGHPNPSCVLHCKALDVVHDDMLLGRGPLDCLDLASLANLLGHEKPLSARADGVGLRSKTVLSTASLNQMSRGVYLVFVSEE